MMLGKNLSLRSRLLIWLLGPLLLIGLVALWDANRAARETADEISDRLLAGSLLAIAEQVFVNDDGELEVDVPYVALQMLTSSADDRVFYRIESLEGDFVTGYRQLDLSSNLQTDDAETQFFDSTFRGSDIRIATFVGATSSNTKSLSFRVGVAETTNARAATAEQILVRSALRQAVLIIAATLLVWVAVTLALRPLSNLKQAIDRRNPDDMRPIKHKVPLEVEGVVERINDLLARFSSSIEALRNFTSNASHQFRTPLALIHTHLELAQRANTPQEKTTAIQNANKAVGDAERLMSQMLLLSRIDTLSKSEIALETCDLASVAREVCEEFVLHLSATKKHTVQIGFDGEASLFVSGRAVLLKEVVRNLIDNSIVHGGNEVIIDVSVERSSKGGVLKVADRSGEGAFPPTEKNTSNEENPLNWNGMGLRIVREILNLFGAELRYQNPSSNGTTAIVLFQLPKNN